MTVKTRIIKGILFFLLVIFSSCSTVQYFIVRHAEKEGQGMGAGSAAPNDPALSVAGKERAKALREILKNKKIGYIFSTNTIRTKTTAQPLADQLGLNIEIYGPIPDSSFINKLRALNKNVLIVGHSNTVDDIVNKLCKRKEVAGDLPDSSYSKLFIVTVKGKKTSFREEQIPAHN
jgi:broad specificity phosphatase PhoE